MKKLEVSSFELRVAAFAVAVASSMTLSAATNDFYVGSSYTTDAKHFNRVKDALAAVPENSGDTTIIHMQSGIYREKVILSGARHNILLLGDERHPENYVISWNDANGFRHDPETGELLDPSTANNLTTFEVGGTCTNFEARGVTFYNSAWQEYWDGTLSNGPGQALAIQLTCANNPCVFRHCRFISGQDTMYINGAPIYCEDCYIEGTVDFIYGSRCGLFNRCDIFSRGGYVTADGEHPAKTKMSYLFWKCRVNVEEGKKTTLGRSWRNTANVWFADCYLGKGVESGLWTYWNDVKGVTVLRDYGTRSETRFTPPNLKGQWGEGIIVRGTMEEFWQAMAGLGFDSIDDIFSQEAGDWRPVMRNGIEVREAL